MYSTMPSPFVCDIPLKPPKLPTLFSQFHSQPADLNLDLLVPCKFRKQNTNLQIPGDSIRDQTLSPIVGGHQRFAFEKDVKLTIPQKGHGLNHRGFGVFFFFGDFSWYTNPPKKTPKKN